MFTCLRCLFASLLACFFSSFLPSFLPCLLAFFLLFFLTFFLPSFFVCLFVFVCLVSFLHLLACLLIYLSAEQSFLARGWSFLKTSLDRPPSPLPPSLPPSLPSSYPFPLLRDRLRVEIRFPNLCLGILSFNLFNSKIGQPTITQEIPLEYFFFFFLFIYLGDVLLPIDTSSRVLELAYKLDFHWYFISSSSLPHLFLISSLSLVYFFFISCSWPF